MERDPVVARGLHADARLRRGRDLRERGHEPLGSVAVVVVERRAAQLPAGVVDHGCGVFALANVDPNCYHIAILSGMGLSAPR